MLTIANKPPKTATLSSLVFNNKVQELKKNLSKNKSNVNVIDSTGETHSWTPLYWSVKTRNKQCTKLLLEAGADMNAIINDGDECYGTVLDLVTIRNDTEMEAILRGHAEKDQIAFSKSFKAIRTKIRGKSPAFNFKNYD